MKFDNLQDYFNQAIAFFSTMPRQSLAETGACTYYNPYTQDACIVGQFGDDAFRENAAYNPAYHGSIRVLLWNLTDDEVTQLIPDCEEVLEYRKSYLPQFQYTTAYDDIEEIWGHMVRRFPNLALVQDLQSIHDKASSWGENGFIGWEDIQRVARHYRLKFTMPDMRIPIRDENTDKISSAQLEMAQF